MQLTDCQRKLGIIPGAFLPVGGAAGTVLTKASGADYDVIWGPSPLPVAGNGIVVVGNVVHFAQVAAYTAGAIPFATGAATIGFDAANLFWDDAANRLGIGTNLPGFTLDVNGTFNVSGAVTFAAMTPGSALFIGAGGLVSEDNANFFWDAANAYLGLGTAIPSDRLYVTQAYADVANHNLGSFVATTSTVGGTKRALLAGLETAGAANFNAGQLTSAAISCTHNGAGNVTGALRVIGMEFYHGKGAAGTGNMDASIGLYLQSVNLNALGTITASYDLYIPTPVTTGAISTNYAIYQINPSAFLFFGGNISVATATFSPNIGIRMQKSYTVSGATATYGYYADITETAGALSTGIHRGGYFNVSLAGAQNYSSVFAGLALQAQIIHGGSGTANELVGVYSVALKNSTGPVTTAYAFRGAVQNGNATNAIGTGYTYYGATPSVTGAITTFYGLWLSAGAGSTVYGIWQDGTTDLNALRGFTALGSNAPVNTTWALFGVSTATISSLRIPRGSAAYGGTVEGDFWNDFTQHTLTAYVAGVKQFDSRVLFVQTADATVTNTNAETTMFGAGVGTLTLPANFFVVGKTLRICLRGFHTMDATPPSTVYRVKLGAVTFATVTFTDLNDSNQYFELDFLLTCRTTGAGGTGYGQGYILMHEATGVVSADLRQLVMTATAAMNTTGALTLDVTAQPAGADAGSLITITNATVEVVA